ncbi:HypC/HybG/HupF family hydrogenase formation chaperone [Aquaspirillum soli]
MCLALPVRIIERWGVDRAKAEIEGVVREISVALVPEVDVGEYVILHVGYAIARLDVAEAERTLALMAQWARGEGGL